jgi:hypothetical protein
MGRRFLALLVGIRDLGKTFPKSLCFSHVARAAAVVDNRLLIRAFSGVSRDLGLLGGEPAHLSPDRLPVRNARVVLRAPLADQRREQALPSQIRATVATLACLLESLQVNNLVRHGEPAPPPRAVGSEVGRIHPFIVVRRCNR